MKKRQTKCPINQFDRQVNTVHISALMEQINLFGKKNPVKEFRIPHILNKKKKKGVNGPQQ